MASLSKQRADVINYLHHQLFLSPLLTEEHKERLDAILADAPSDDFLKGLHKMLQAEQQEFNQALEAMPTEELQEVHQAVLVQERQQQRVASQEQEEQTREEEQKFLDDMEAYFSSR